MGTGARRLDADRAPLFTLIAWPIMMPLNFIAGQIFRPNLSSMLVETSPGETLDDAFSECPQCEMPTLFFERLLRR